MGAKHAREGNIKCKGPEATMNLSVSGIPGSQCYMIRIKREEVEGGEFKDIATRLYCTFFK